MKKLLILAFVLLSTVFFYSCDEDYTYDELKNDSYAAFCDKIYSCKEGEEARAFFGANEKACVDTMKNGDEDKDAECVDFNAAKAEDCISCIEGLSCSEFFEDNASDKYCKVCDDVCKNTKKD